VLAKSIRGPVAVAAALTALLGAVPSDAGAPDRLERFRSLATARLAAAQLTDETASEAYREIYSLLDDEIVESLSSGGVFASTEFLQDRLDAFTEACRTVPRRRVQAQR
jgi:hypothetical protein